MNAKIKQLFDSIDAKAVLLRAPDPNFYYFTALPFGHFIGNGLLLRPGRKPLLFTMRFYSLSALQRKGIAVKNVRDSEHFKKLLKKELRTRKLGLNYAAVTKKGFSDLRKKLRGKKFIDVSKQLAKVRAIKGKEELSKIARAAKITERVLNSVPRIFKKGMTEKELALALETRFRERADNNVPFPVIVASGRSAAVPHHSPGNKKIEKGFLLIDAGCRYANYSADLSRTFFVGKAGPDEKQLYEIVHSLQRHAISLIKPGAKCSAVFKQAGKLLKEKTGLPLIHGLGHGLGIETHDFPQGFLEKSKDVLLPGMVLTVEPAVYGKFGGIRIEDDVVITSSSSKRLSKAPKQLVELR